MCGFTIFQIYSKQSQLTLFKALATVDLGDYAGKVKLEKISSLLNLKEEKLAPKKRRQQQL